MSSKEEKQNKELFLLSLPDDLLLRCVSRVSRFHYPTLSLVSKRFRSLIASPELYKIRSLSGRTETCLYLCLKLDDECRWFTVWRKTNQKTLTKTNERKKKKIPSGYDLVPVRIPRSPVSHSLGLVVVGSNIYSFAGSKASILDCRSYTWSEAQSLQVKLDLLCVSVVDQKIYVAGRYEEGDSECSENLVVVFDTITQSWDPVPIPCSEIQGEVAFRSVCIDGKFHMRVDSDVFAYDSEEGRWDLVEGNMRQKMLYDSYGVVDNVLYNGLGGEFRWYDTEERTWKELKGLVGLPDFPGDTYSNDITYVKLADNGGKMVFLWYWYKPYPFCGGCEVMILCGEIALERRENREIWGTVEWFDHLLTFRKPSHQSFQVVKVLAATF